MSQIASNSVLGNKSMSFLIFTLIFSSATRLTLGVPTEFPAAFEGVKAVVQPETSTSYWGFSDMISYGVQSIQSAIKFVIGVEDHPREFYVVHIKDEKNPENSKEVLRERGREGIDKDIPLKGGKLPGNSLIVNPKDPVTEVVNRKNPETEHAPSPETTAPQTKAASEIPITEIVPQNGSNASTKPTTNGIQVPSPKTTAPQATPPENTAPEIPVAENIPQNGNDASTKPTTNGIQVPSPKTTAPQATPPANTAPEIPVAENIPQNGNNASTTPTTNGEHENIDPVAKLPHNESTDLKSPLPPTHTQIPFKETGGEKLPLFNQAPETAEPKENPKIPKSGNVQFNQPEIFSGVNDHLGTGVSPTSQNSPLHSSNMKSSPLDGEALKSSQHPTDPMISNHHTSPGVMLASSPAVEKIGQPAREEIDPWGQARGESQNLGNLLPTIDSSIPHSNDEVTQPPVQISPLPQYVNSNHNSLEGAEPDISKILEPLANQTSKKVTPEDDEFPDEQDGGKSDYGNHSGISLPEVEETQPSVPDDDVDSPIPEPTHQETPEPPTSDPEESTSVLECETKFAGEYCEESPESCDKFKSDEDFWLHIKQISGCEAKSAESSVFDPNKLITMNECEIQYEKNLCESDPDFCKEFQSDKEFLDYVKSYSGCETEGEENGDHSSTGHDADADPFHQEEPSLSSEPLDLDENGVQDYDNDALSNPSFEPAEVPEKKKTGTKKKSKSIKEKRSKSKSGL